MISSPHGQQTFGALITAGGGAQQGHDENAQKTSDYQAAEKD
jgi:hypothetical protein